MFQTFFYYVYGVVIRPIRSFKIGVGGLRQLFLWKEMLSKGCQGGGGGLCDQISFHDELLKVVRSK